MNKVMTNISLIAAVLALVLQSGCNQKQAKPAAEAAVASATAQGTASEAGKSGAVVEAAPAAAKTGGPVITFEATEHDFGNVGPGTKHTFVYKFKNTGNELLKISDVKSPCGCTIPSLTKKEYAPGESGEINVTYTAITTPIPVTKHVYVVSNDKNKPEFEISLKAVSVPKVKVDPDNLLLSLHKPNGGLPPITLTSTDGQAFSIKSFVSLGNAITADFDPNAKDTKFTLTPKVDIEKLRGNLNGVVTIELTHPECASVEARYVAKADYETQPAIFYIPKGLSGKVERKELWVVSNYDQSFDIESITSEKGSIKEISRQKEGNKYNVVVEITPPAMAGSKFFLDNLIIKIKNGPTLKVRCNVWLQPAPSAPSAPQAAPK
jgi:hypothetical protein